MGQQHDAEGNVLNVDENDIACATLLSDGEAEVLPVLILLDISTAAGPTTHYFKTRWTHDDTSPLKEEPKRVYLRVFPPDRPRRPPCAFLRDGLGVLEVRRHRHCATVEEGLVLDTHKVG